MISKKIIDEISRFLDSQKCVFAGYFFGSKTTGNTHPGSDLDMALFMNGMTGSYDHFFFVSGEIMRIMKKGNVKEKIDIRPVFTDVRHLVPLNDSSLFAFEVIRANRLFYQKRPEDVALLELHIIRKYRDFQHIDRIRLSYFQNLINQETYGYSKQ